MAKITIEGLNHIDIVRMISDAFSHLYERECQSVRPSVAHELNSREMVYFRDEIEQNGVRNMKLCHRDDSDARAHLTSDSSHLCPVS